MDEPRILRLERVEIVVRGIKVNQRREEIPSDDMGKGLGVLVFIEHDLVVERPKRLLGARCPRSRHDDRSFKDQKEKIQRAD